MYSSEWTFSRGDPSSLTGTLMLRVFRTSTSASICPPPWIRINIYQTTWTRISSSWWVRADWRSVDQLNDIPGAAQRPPLHSWHSSWPLFCHSQTCRLQHFRGSRPRYPQVLDTQVETNHGFLSLNINSPQDQQQESLLASGFRDGCNTRYLIKRTDFVTIV